MGLGETVTLGRGNCYDWERPFLMRGINRGGKDHSCWEVESVGLGETIAKGGISGVKARPPYGGGGVCGVSKGETIHPLGGVPVGLKRLFTSGGG